MLGFKMYLMLGYQFMIFFFFFLLNKSVGDRTTFSCMLFQVLVNVIMGC